jgi:hypothetical protein
MTKVTLSSFADEAVPAGIPQLAVNDDMLPSAGDVSLELADLSVGQLSAVAALMLALDAAEARAAAAESLLASHEGHCICRASQVAGEEVATVAASLPSFRAAA